VKGLPVLATRVGGNDEPVVACETGALDALAKGLVAVTADPARAAAMGRAGRRRVEECFSLQTMVRAYYDLYDRLPAEQTGISRPN
jgi:glycosyltransferase involved in cell wall biosynthesis